jgi:hypothetical protein
MEKWDFRRIFLFICRLFESINGPDSAKGEIWLVLPATGWTWSNSQVLSVFLMATLTHRSQGELPIDPEHL